MSSDRTNYSLSTDSLLDFVNTRYQAYFHYNLATFKSLHTEKPVDRTRGDDPPTMWAPTGLDCQQWAETCKAAGMAGGWLTTKHHGGFCLWDSKFTDYDVASSDVKTDVVKVFTDTFRKADLKIGLYYSIIDHHHGLEKGQMSQGIEFIKDQLTELLTNYGPIDYMNFDGWALDFDEIHYFELYQLVKKLQPDCLIINHTYESNIAHADVPFADASGGGYPFHPDYMCPSAASDVLQTGWWADNYGVKRSVDYILKQLDTYNSHNSVYVLNIAPGPDGRLPDDALNRLKEVAAAWKKPADLKAAGENWGFQYDVNKNLAFGKRAKQSSSHKNLTDNRVDQRAEIALDGVLEGNLKMAQTSFTKKEKNPWWQVDLEKISRIDKITIYNRTDENMEALSNYTVSILDDDQKVVWQSHQKDNYPNPAVTIVTGSVEGRYVKIQLSDTNFLHIAEVIVEGESKE